MTDNNKKRLHGFEVEPVRDAVKEKLVRLVRDEGELEVAQVLTRVLFRLQYNQVGNQPYPSMGTFAEIRE